MPPLSSEFLELAMKTARDASEQGADLALGYFQKDVPSEQKDDDSPVTIADREAERLIIKIIRTTFPEHSILGEESGLLEADPRYRWIVDPIDGTRGFIRKGGFWGTLIGLEVDNKVVAGAMRLPVLGLSYWAAQGLGCFKNGERIFLPASRDLSSSTLSLGEIPHILKSPYAGSLNRLICSCASTRSYGDPGGLMMVLDGIADIWVEGGVKPWDLAHAKILIEEAGGVFTDFEGIETIESGNAIACSRALSSQVLSIMRQQGKGPK